MTTATYIKKSTLSFPDLWNEMGMEKDKGGRWESGENTPDWAREYLKGYRTPSRSWPMSHAKALLSQKFAKLLTEKDPKLAIKLGVAE